MLLELRVQNLAVIDELTIEFGPGLNVLTGETGAGKSIILGALALVVGEKANPQMIRTGEEFASVEAAVETNLPAATRRTLEEAGIVIADDEPIILSRHVGANGRSRAYINGRLATNALLKAVGEGWIDIHGQHEHQSLFREEVHLELLDAYARNEALREEMAASYARIQQLGRELRALQAERRDALREREFLEHEVNEIARANVMTGEDEALDAERRRLVNAGRLHDTARALFARLYDSAEGAVCDALREATSELQRLSELDPSLKELQSRLEAATVEVEDVAAQIREYGDRVEFNPGRLEEIEERLQTLFQLKRRYGGTIEAVLDRYRASEKKLRALETSEERIGEVKETLRAVLREASARAFALSEARRSAAKKLEKRVEKELAELNMAKSRFRVDVMPVESESGLIKREKKGYKVGSTGIDRVEFLISPNVGEELRPLNRIASGGEISRVMLALKTVLSDMDTISTLVFDEIDAGIGGETAHVLGRKLQRLAASRQALCITHLPPIAALADRHFRVEKRVERREGRVRTRTVARQLEGDERVKELARMLGGETETSRAHAQELLRRGPYGQTHAR